MKYANPDLRSKKAVIGTYVPADLFEKTSHYSSYGRAKTEVGNLVGKLSELASEDVFISESSIEKLCVNESPSVCVVMLEVGFTYNKKRDARKTFKKILDLGLMLRCNHTYLSPMIQKGEFDEGLRYEVEDKGRETMRWLAGRFRTVKILGIRGFMGFKYELNT